MSHIVFWLHQMIHPMVSGYVVRHCSDVANQKLDFERSLWWAKSESPISLSEVLDVHYHGTPAVL